MFNAESSSNDNNPIKSIIDTYKRSNVQRVGSELFCILNKDIQQYEGSYRVVKTSHGFFLVFLKAMKPKMDHNGKVDWEAEKRRYK